MSTTSQGFGICGVGPLGAMPFPLDDLHISEIARNHVASLVSL